MKFKQVLENIEGKWLGEYRFDVGYPVELQVKHVSFTMELTDLNGIIAGTWTDDHTKHFNTSPAIIKGSFGNNKIEFIKTYPCRIGFDKDFKTVINPEAPGQTTQFSGKLRKSLFSNEYYFKGDSATTVEFTDKMGRRRTHRFVIIWKMKKQQ